MFAGNDGGASQFNGGGFMPSPGGQAGGGTAQKRTYDNKSQAVRAVTVKQLVQALDQSAADALVIDNKEITNVTLVGKVLSVTEDSVTFNLTLDDGTGRVAVKMYSTDESDLERQARSELREGIYARVFGHVGAMNHERHVVAFSIRPVTDHNEVSYHLSQVIFQHLHLAKGGDAAAAAAPAAAAGGAAYGAAYGAPAGGMGGAPAAGGQTPVQKEVLDVFNAPDARALEAGLTVPDVLARLGGRYPPQAVLGAVNFLVDEGHLYSTIDDAHWKSCCA